MKRKKTVAIIGHFGGGTNVMDGQTVKTKILYEELCKATDWRIERVDTYYLRKNPLRLAWETALALLTTRDVLILLSINGMRVCFPVLYCFAKLFGTRVYHSVIGGNLGEHTRKYPKFRKYLNAFVVNWTETELLKRDLEKNGIRNAEVMPNFKRLKLVDPKTVCGSACAPYRFCTFSRVAKEKGIEDAVESIQAINKKYGKTVCILDIYGKADESYRERFAQLQQTFTQAVTYCGSVPFSESVETIKNYYALLFPTTWDGEGLAGTVIDAFSACVPVIATDWRSNGEIIEQGKDGILYPSAYATSLQEAIEWAISHPEEMQKMKTSCGEKAKAYTPDVHVAKIVHTIQKHEE